MNVLLLTILTFLCDASTLVVGKQILLEDLSGKCLIK